MGAGQLCVAGSHGARHRVEAANSGVRGKCGGRAFRTILCYSKKSFHSVTIIFAVSR